MGLLGTCSITRAGRAGWWSRARRRRGRRRVFLYRPARDARNLDGGCLPLVRRHWPRSRGRNTSSIQSAVLGGPRARSDAVYARALHFRSLLLLAPTSPGASISASLPLLHSHESPVRPILPSPGPGDRFYHRGSRGYAEERTRANSRCIVVSECRKVTVQSASKPRSISIVLAHRSPPSFRCGRALPRILDTFGGRVYVGVT